MMKGFPELLAVQRFFTNPTLLSTEQETESRLRVFEMSEICSSPVHILQQPKDNAEHLSSQHPTNIFFGYVTIFMQDHLDI